MHLKTTTTTLAVALAIALTNVSIANAQRRIEITPFAGYYIASDLYSAYSSTANPGSSNVELTNSFMWGGRLTASTPRAGVEFAYTRAGSDVKIKRLQGTQPREKIGRMNLDSYDINFLAYQPTNNPRVMPFGVLGIGWTVTHPEIDPDFHIASAAQPKSNTLFNFNFGLGTKIEMNPKLSLRLEGRWRVTDTSITTSSGVFCDAYGYCYSYASDWYNSGELIGGISYALGGAE